MKVTAQEEYGLRCVLNLARQRGGTSESGARDQESSASAEGVPEAVEAVTVAEIAEREGLSVQYAGKLIRILGKAGLVESVRGCKGGYRLARAAETISVAEVLAALGGRVYEPGVCERYTGDRTFCVHTSDCSVRSLWSGLQLMIDAVLSRTTLRDLSTNERSVGEWMHSNLSALHGFLEEDAQGGSESAEDPASTGGALRPLGRQQYIPIVRSRGRDQKPKPTRAATPNESSKASTS